MLWAKGNNVNALPQLTGSRASKVADDEHGLTGVQQPSDLLPVASLSQNRKKLLLLGKMR